MAETDPRLASDFCGMHFATPLVLLSGCVGFGEEYTRVAGVLQSRCGRRLPQGHDRHPAPGQCAAPRLRDTGRHAQCHRPAEPRRRPGGRRDPADPGFRRDALHRQCLRLDHRGIHRGHAALRRFADRCDRDQHLLPERQGRRRRLRQRPGHVGTRGRGLPRRDPQTADHQAVAEPDRYRRQRPALYRGRQRRLRGHQHDDGHGDRHRDAHAATSATTRAACPVRRSSRSRCSRCTRSTR